MSLMTPAEMATFLKEWNATAPGLGGLALGILHDVEAQLGAQIERLIAGEEVSLCFCLGDPNGASAELCDRRKLLVNVIAETLGPEGGRERAVSVAKSQVSQAYRKAVDLLRARNWNVAHWTLSNNGWGCQIRVSIARETS